MELRVLGPLEVLLNGERLHFARRQQPLILGILALGANQLVPSERPIDLLWGAGTPRQAQAIVQTRMSEVAVDITHIARAGPRWRHDPDVPTALCHGLQSARLTAAEDLVDIQSRDWATTMRLWINLAGRFR